MWKLWIGFIGSIILQIFNATIVKAQPPKNLASTKIIFTPLAEQLFSQPTAESLGKGEVLINLDTRTFFFPDLVSSGVDNEDSAVNFNTGFSWGISDDLQLTLQFQHVDSSSPVKQGDFISERTEDNEAAGEVKYNFWRNQAKTQSLSGVLSASWGTRGFLFTEPGEETEINNRDVFVSVAVPFTTNAGDRWQFNLSPTVAFFNEDTAGFFQRLPNDNNSFGTVLGLGGGVSWQISERLFAITDVFLPITGNNSINRNSGQPDKAIAYSAGFRFLTNLRLALDVYATNTFASYAPLSLTADRDFMGLGANLTFMPDVISANKKYADGFSNNAQDNEVFTTDGIGFFDGGTIPSGEFALQLQGGSQGILTSLRYGLLEDFEGGIFLDYVAGDVDESEQGISGKVRFFQQGNAPFTLSGAATVGLTNEPFINFFENDANEFERRDLDKTVPVFTPGGDNSDRGELIIATFALPIHYEIDRGTAVWFTPILGYVQRLGLEIGGFNLGSAIALSEELHFLAEVGTNLGGEGNTFVDGSRANKIPWTVGVRWLPLSLLGKEVSNNNSDPYLELYLTNRVGSSTWHQLRVRENNDVGFGAGLSLPF